MEGIAMKHYSKEFKEEALKLSDEIGVKKAAQQLGIAYYTGPHVCLQLCLLPYFREKLLKKFYGCMQAHEEEYSSGSIKQLK